MKTFWKGCKFLISLILVIVIGLFAFFKAVMKWLFSFKQQLRFWNARRKAKTCHRLTGKQYHVVPDSNNKLKVVDHSYIDHYNKAVKNTKHKKIDIYDLLKMSYYSTPVQGLNRK